MGRGVDGKHRVQARRPGSRRVLRILGILAFGVFLSLAAGEAKAYEQRTSTPSVGIMAGIGFMSGSDEFATEGTTPTIIPYEAFDLGFGLGIHVRYSLDRRSAIGVSFEDLRFERKSGEDTEAEQYQVNNFLARYYVYFARRERLSRYIAAGIGFHRPSFRLDDQENILPGEGLTANLGVGLEYFFTRAVALDGAVDGYLLRPKGGSIVAAEARIGLQLYFIRR